jgi:hypothetical protein
MNATTQAYTGSMTWDYMTSLGFGSSMTDLLNVSFDFSDQISNAYTTQNSQTATANLSCHSAAYTGPSYVEVLFDQVFGTFLFSLTDQPTPGPDWYQIAGLIKHTGTTGTSATGVPVNIEIGERKYGITTDGTGAFEVYIPVVHGRPDFTATVTANGVTSTIIPGSGSPVTMVVPQLPPTLSAAPASISFNDTLGVTSPAPQTVSLTSIGGNNYPLPFSVETSVLTPAGGTWLSATPLSGATPSALTISYNPAGLADGAYAGSVTVTTAGSTTPPITIPVALYVTSLPTAPNLNFGGAHWGYTSGSAYQMVGAVGNNGANYNNIMVTQVVWTAAAGTGTITDTTALPIAVGNLAGGTVSSSITLTATMPNTVTQFTVCVSGTAVSPISGSTVAWTDHQNCSHAYPTN